MRARSKNGSVTSAALVVLSAGALAWAGLHLVPSDFNATRVAPKKIQQPGVAIPARAWLGVVGLGADALAAAGVDADASEVVLKDVQAYVDQNGESLVAAIEAYNAAIKQADGAERMVRAGKGLEQPAAVNAATTSAALANRTAAVDGVLNAAFTHLNDSQRSLLSIIRQNADREVPAPYKVVNRKDHEWVALRDALTAERQAAQRSEQLPASTASFLARVRAETATSKALANTARLLPALSR